MKLKTSELLMIGFTGLLIFLGLSFSIISKMEKPIQSETGSFSGDLVFSGDQNLVDLSGKIQDNLIREWDCANVDGIVVGQMLSGKVLSGEQSFDYCIQIP